MRLIVVLLCGGLAACTSGSVSGPGDPAVLVEVPRPGVSPYSPSLSEIGSEFASPAEDGIASGAQGTTPLDDDRLNLTLYTIEQQKLDAAAAERELANARSQLVIIQPGALPDRVVGANIALFAQQTTNAVGERIYERGFGGTLRSGCGRYGSSDEAQRAFLASGGPERDALGVDKDGDGFACSFDPIPYRQLKL